MTTTDRKRREIRAMADAIAEALAATEMAARARQAKLTQRAGR